MPPLRERGEDAVMLFMKFAMDTAAQYGIPQPLRLTPEAQQVVMSYKWPGNIRQLRNVVEQMNILCSDRTVTPEVLERYEVRPSVETTDLTLHQPSLTAKQGESVDQTLKMMQLMIQSLKMDVEMLKQRVETQPQSQHAIIHQLPAPAYPEASEYPESSEYSEYADYSDKSDNSDDDEDLNLEKMERRLIEKALRRSRNRRKVAADDLGISERTLYRKIKDYGIEE